MPLRLLPFLLLLCFACKSAEKTAQKKAIASENKDVVALAYLVRDYMLQTSSANFTLSDIVQYDTLGRVTGNFSSLEVGSWPDWWRGGYVVYFKFSDKRNKDLVTLKSSEVLPWRGNTKEKIGRSDAQLSMHYDGEIRFYYPERLYRIVGITIREKRGG
jgi:hypothetical protein